MNKSNVSIGLCTRNENGMLTGRLENVAIRLAPMNNGIDLLKKDAWRRTPHTLAQWASEGEWKCSRYLKYICDVCYTKILAGNARIMIHGPPQYGKSVFLKWLVTWFLENWPEKNTMYTSYAATLAVDHAREIRDRFEYNQFLRTKLKEDSKAVDLWHTAQGGGLRAVGVGGGASGFGSSLSIGDDWIKDWEEATSSRRKEVVWNWYHSTFNARLRPRGSIVIAQTRWTDDDICARLFAENPEIWTVITLPEVAEDNDVLGRLPGEVLFPEMYDQAAVALRKQEAGSVAWDALHQQRPQSFSTGRLFNRFTAANISNEIALRADLPLAISLDFNINPGSHLIVGQYDGKRDQFNITDEFYGPRWDVRMIINAFGEWLKLKGWKPGTTLAFPSIHVHGDATGESENATVAESAYDLVRQLLRHMMLPHMVKHLNRNPPLRESVDAVNEAFRDVDEKIHILIHPRCAGLIKDLQTLRRDENGLPEETSDLYAKHFADCARYYVHFVRPLHKFNAAQQPSGPVLTIPQM